MNTSKTRVSKTYSAQISGINADIITIEADISNGLHTFSIVGLGDRAVAESRDRISSAIKNSGFVSPKQKNHKVVISLAPADIRKEGPVFDLGMAMAYLLATHEIFFESETKLFLGELSLEGNIRPVYGVLAMVRTAQEHGFTEIYVSKENAREAALIQNIAVYPANSLKEIIDHLSLNDFSLPRAAPAYPTDQISRVNCTKNTIDFNQIVGQENAKRALEIAAAGRHTIAMYGPPGAGKTMLAKAFPTILPQLSYEESIEVTAIHSIAKILKNEIVRVAPFRAPHHTSSYTSLIGGGGNTLHTGEITLAHKGVLFLDEFPEFDRRVIDSLRQPLEDRKITITRAHGTITYPADCIVILAMNPCPCGYLEKKKCICTDNEILRYKKKISGPIADRIDIWISVSKVPYSALENVTDTVFSSLSMQKRVISAREFEKKIGSATPLTLTLSNEVRSILVSFSEKLNLSTRGYTKTIRVARTIANLAGSDEIKKEHLLEALQYRQKDF